MIIFCSCFCIGTQSQKTKTRKTKGYKSKAQMRRESYNRYSDEEGNQKHDPDYDTHDEYNTSDYGASDFSNYLDDYDEEDDGRFQASDF